MPCLTLSPMYENDEYTGCFSPHIRDSILIYLTVGGSMIPMHIMETNSIASVKLRIQTFKGFFVKKSKLIFEGKELAHNKSCVREFELSIEASSTPDTVPNLAADQLGPLSITTKFPKRNRLSSEFLLEPVFKNSNIKIPPLIQELVKITLEGLEKGRKPIRSSEGSGGAYLLHDSSGLKYVSVFKPTDEEPMAINNPRGLPISVDGEGLKRGTRVGQGALREVAAYILDYPRKGPRSYHNNEEQGFAGVPPTVMIKCMHEGFHHPKGYKNVSSNVKIGSLQMFMRNIGSCEDMGPGAFPVEEVHKISVLDIRLVNADRHAGNILVAKNGEEDPTVLIPIDHGYCLPESFEDCTFDWLYWPQAQEPYSPDTIEYIKSLDAEEDIKLLKSHGWELPPECARILSISTMLLQKGAEKGLTPFTIGSIMCRETPKKKSVIEQIIEKAEEAVLLGTSEAAFIDLVSVIVDNHLEGLFS
ncbi:unnamed protein product [Lathyrus sativus]|nr:unnamed protein product [Lathyrus sativus]